jgi:hypothetical protein
LGARVFGDDDLVIMAIVNRTPTPSTTRARRTRAGAALEAVDRAVAEGAAIVDIGGVKAGPGDPVDAAEEIRRTASFVAAVRDRHPDLVISIDTWRHEVADVACDAGADLLNDAWGGVDPLMLEVAAARGAGYVCTHAGGQQPRTRPHRVAYDDVVADILERTVGLAERAVGAGVARESILDRPWPRLRQEHPPLARGDATARRAGRDRLAGAGLLVQQGLRRRDAGPARRRPAGRDARRRPPSAPGSAPGSSAPTTSPRRGRRSTWSPRSGAPDRPPWPVAASPDPRLTTVALRARIVVLDQQDPAAPAPEEQT